MFGLDGSVFHHDRHLAGQADHELLLRPVRMTTPDSGGWHIIKIKNAADDKRNMAVKFYNADVAFGRAGNGLQINLGQISNVNRVLQTS